MARELSVQLWYEMRARGAGKIWWFNYGHEVPWKYENGLRPVFLWLWNEVSHGDFLIERIIFKIFIWKDFYLESIIWKNFIWKIFIWGNYIWKDLLKELYLKNNYLRKLYLKQSYLEELCDRHLFEGLDLIGCNCVY